MAADKAAMNIVATGVVNLKPKCCPENPITVNNVKLIPAMSHNLLSVSQIVRRGHEVRFTNQGVTVVDPEGTVIATGSHDIKNGLFLFQEHGDRRALSLASLPENLDIWHRRMGHLNVHSLSKLKNGLVSGVHFKESVIGNCAVCAKGKQFRLPFPKNGHRANEVLEVVHTDLCGPMEEASLGGSKYYVSFTDDKTRRIFIYFLEQKSEAQLLNAFNQFHSHAERQTGRKLKTIRSDNGKEFINKSLQRRLADLGIQHQMSTEYTRAKRVR